MPDVTVSFTDAQWTRVGAASTSIKKAGESGNVDATYLSTLWKNQISEWVIQHEKSAKSTDSW